MAESQAVLAIFNLALSHVGEKTIALPGQSPECQLHFPDVRDRLLSFAPWTFATTVKELVQLAHESHDPSAHVILDEFRFIYALPTVPPLLRVLALRPRKVRYKRRLWIRTNDPEHPVAVIVTDAPEVRLEYILRAGEGLWMPLFTSAVALGLAVAISGKIARRGTLRESIKAEFSDVLTRAIDIDGHQDSPQRVEQNTTYLRVRDLGALGEIFPFLGDIEEPLGSFPV